MPCPQPERNAHWSEPKVRQENAHPYTPTLNLLQPPIEPPPSLQTISSPNLRPGKAKMENENENENHSISCLVSPFELIRNCDLPPPQKLFPGIDDPAAMGLGDEKRGPRPHPGDGRLELLRALRLSQTRAREAEERSAEAAAERDAVATALIGEAARSAAYRRWVRVLELEVAALRSRTRRREREEGDSAEEEERRASMAWMVALAIPLGIAGIGLALASRYLI
ncbi:uncharacterized protein LOC115739379 [Rhodamnia argentea]|uniref:Uncharacterized protein LOC115739379 n=1 Tax=Rhodamnia argentea TaxID=178133 RepID=A0ABM3GUC9_9MYRT|nr:uncharacterized protein LOC115739379 [Rhodamnia argentea]